MILRLGKILGPDPRAIVQTLVALVVSIAATLGAGLFLASAEERLADLPGLLLLVPAAIGQRGNVFGGMGSRLGTAIHMGTFKMSGRLETLFGQNVAAAMVLSLVASVWLAVIAKLLALAFGIANSMSLLDFIAVSVVGGLLASAVVLVITVALSAGSIRFGWDLDNVTAPLVTASGDLVTLPALLIGSVLVGTSATSEVVASVSLFLAVLVLGMVYRSAFALLRRIVIESLPVLAAASTVSLLAGIVVEKRLSEFLDEPALLILIPVYFGMAGAMGGILSSRLATKLHLGLIEPVMLPQRPAWEDIRSIMFLSVPIFALVGGAAHLAGVVADLDSPGLGAMVAVAALGGVAAIAIIVGVAYYGTLLAIRFGLDPDTAAIPFTNSVLDLVGAFTLILAIIAIGVG